MRQLYLSLEIDYCEPNPCKNNGFCAPNDAEDGFICHCSQGYQGLVCDGKLYHAFLYSY